MPRTQLFCFIVALTLGVIALFSETQMNFLGNIAQTLAAQVGFQQYAKNPAIYSSRITHARNPSFPDDKS